MVDLTELTDLFHDNETKVAELIEFAEIMDKMSYQAGNQVFCEDAQGDCLYLIKRGEIKISRMVGENKEKLLLILGRGMYFGNFSMINGGALKVTAEALEDSEVLIFRKKELDVIAEKNSAFGVKIMSEILSSLFNIYREVDSKFIGMLQLLMLGEVLNKDTHNKTLLGKTFHDNSMAASAPSKPGGDGNGN